MSGYKNKSLLLMGVHYILTSLQYPLFNFRVWGEVFNLALKDSEAGRNVHLPSKFQVTEVPLLCATVDFAKIPSLSLFIAFVFL